MSYSVTPVFFRDEFFELHAEWDALLEVSSERDYYFSYDWYHPLLTFCSSLPSGQLVVLVCRREGELQGLLPCFLSKDKRHFLRVNTLGLYGNIYTPRRGAVVRKGEEHDVVTAFVDFLCNEFSAKWDVIDFRNLSQNDKVVCMMADILAQRKISMVLKNQFDNVRTYLGKNGSESFFLSLSKKLRQNIRSGINKFCKTGSIVVWLIQNEKQDIDTALNDYYRIYDESWKENEIDPDFHKNLAAYLVMKNKLRLFILYYREGGSAPRENSFNITSINDGLYIGDTSPGNGYIPIAANYFVVDGSLAYYLKTAYRGTYSKFSAGTVLFWFAVKHFVEIDHCEIIDHQQGKEEYKLKWGEVYETRYGLQAANPDSLIGELTMWLTNFFLPMCRKVKNLLRK